MELSEFIEVMNRDYYRAGVYHTMKNPDQDYTSGNHHVINATYYKIVFDNSNDVISLSNFVNNNREIAKDFIEKSRGPNGVFNRSPTKTDLQGHDDNIGIEVTSACLSLPYRKEIFDHGNKWVFPKFKGIPVPLKWYYNNQDTKELNIKSWHGRFLWLTGFIKAANHISPGLFEELNYYLLLRQSINNKDLTDTSVRILIWLMNDSMKGYSDDLDEEIAEWEEDLFEKYPGGMGDVFAIYHGKDHPFALYMKGKI